MKKGISLIVLVITIIILSLIVGTTAIVSFDAVDEIKYMRFKSTIVMVEKETRKTILKNQSFGEFFSENNNEEKYAEAIVDINQKYQIDIVADGYRIVSDENNSLKDLGVDKITGTFFVNYTNGKVFSANPIIYQKEKIYLY